MPVSQAETLNFFFNPFLVLHLTLEYSCSYVFIKIAKPKTKLQLLAEKAIQGDEQALEYLQLEEINVVGNMSSSISWQTLCANYNYLAHMLVVATKLGLECLKISSRLGLKHACHIAPHHYQKDFPEVATTVTIEQLAEHLSQVLDDVPPHHLNRSEDEESSPASEAEPEPEKTKKKKGKTTKPRKKRCTQSPHAGEMTHSWVQCSGLRHQTPSANTPEA